MSKTLYSVSEFFCIAPEKMRAVVCTSEDNDRFVIIYDKDDGTNGIFSLPLMFGDKIKDGNVNPSFLNIVKLNDKYVVTVNEYYYSFESNAKACLDKYIKLTKIETENTTSADDLNGGSDIVAIFKKWNASNAKAFGFEDKIIDDVNSKALKQLKVSRDDLLTAD